MNIKTIKAGELDRRITIEYPTETLTGTGAKSVVWTTWKLGIPARKIYPGSGKEDFSDAKLVSTSDVVFMIRYQVQLIEPKVPNAKMRITDLITGEVFHIEFVAEIGRRMGWKLDCNQRK